MSNVVLLLTLVAVSPGPAFVKSEGTTARSCPKASCAPAGDLKGGDALQIAEVKEGFAKVTVNAREAWVDVKDLAAGNPEGREATAETKVLSCPKPDCKAVATVKAGEKIQVLETSGAMTRVRAGAVVGYVADVKGMKVAAAAPPAYVPPAEPPKYIPPAEPPQYIPPGEAPKYIPAESAPIYIPPAQPAALHQGKPAATNPSLLYVRRANADVREAPKDGAKVVAPMPGGAKLFVRKTDGAWVQVATSEGATAPPLGWVPKADVRDVPPLIYRVKGDGISFRPCANPADKKCVDQKAKAYKKGDAVVSIDESADGKHLLVLLPGQKESFGWVKAAELEPGS